MLQALREEPPLNAKCKDKFLIQSTIITPEKETMPVHDIVRCLSSRSFRLGLTFFFSAVGYPRENRGVQGSPTEVESGIFAT